MSDKPLGLDEMRRAEGGGESPAFGNSRQRLYITSSNLDAIKERAAKGDIQAIAMLKYLQDQEGKQ